MLRVTEEVAIASIRNEQRLEVGQPARFAFGELPRLSGNRLCPRELCEAQAVEKEMLKLGFHALGPLSIKEDAGSGRSLFESAAFLAGDEDRSQDFIVPR